MVKRDFWVWLAGFWEGDGSLAIYHRKLKNGDPSITVGLVISQKRKRAVDVIHNELKDVYKSNLGNRVSYSGYGRTGMYTWYVCDLFDVIRILENIVPHMRFRRREMEGKLRELKIFYDERIKRHTFTKEQDRFILENYGKMRCKDISRAIGKSTSSVYGRARLLGIKILKSWSNAEEQLLYDKSKSAVELSKVLDRTIIAIRAKRRKLGIKRFKRHIWSDEDIGFLKNNFMKMTDEQLAKEIGVTSMSVAHKRVKLGLFKIGSKLFNGSTN